MTSPMFQAPSWYKPVKANSTFDSIANAVLPYLSTEDTRVTAQKLASSSPTQLGSYAKEQYGAAPSKVTSDMRNQFLSADRAAKTLTSLRNMKRVGGYTDASLGTGYSYLTNILQTLQRLGGSGTGGMTRAQYNEFSTAVDNITKTYGNDAPAGQMAPYSTLAAYIAAPTFSAGPLVNNRKGASGSNNSRLYGNG